MRTGRLMYVEKKNVLQSGWTNLLTFDQDAKQENKFGHEKQANDSDGKFEISELVSKKATDGRINFKML